MGRDLVFRPHCISPLDNGGFVCDVCGIRWDTPAKIRHIEKAGRYHSMKAVNDCPGVKRYTWAGWPPDLMTKKQLYEAGYSTGKTKLPAPVGVVPRPKSPDGYLRLYDPSQAETRKTISAAHRERLDKARAKAIAACSCQICGAWVGKKADLCDRCYEKFRIEHDGQRASAWARWALKADAVILDTETTGLDHAEAIEIAVINMQGETLINTRVRPIRRLEAGAVAVHGITAKDLFHAPRFIEVYPQLYQVVKGRHIIIYNVSFDRPIIERMVKARPALPRLRARGWHCAMEWYAQWCGEWSNYWGNYKWQPLGGGHTALGDCVATLERIKEMAR